MIVTGRMRNTSGIIIATEPRARGRQAAELILARMHNPDAPI